MGKFIPKRKRLKMEENQSKTLQRGLDKTLQDLAPKEVMIASLQSSNSEMKLKGQVDSLTAQLDLPETIAREETSHNHQLSKDERIAEQDLKIAERNKRTFEELKVSKGNSEDTKKFEKMFNDLFLES